MCEETLTSVSTLGGDSEYFQVQVGLHQGLALNPFMFTTVMDSLTDSIQGEFRGLCFSQMTLCWWMSQRQAWQVSLNCGGEPLKGRVFDLVGPR